MQCSKAAASVEVKRVIGALCRLLAGLGLVPVPAPEAFRRAKFGGGPKEDPFWLLLFNILQRSGVISSEISCQQRGESRKLVAAGLWQSGYHGDWMYSADGGSFSSRDLLLALGWLLAGGVLEKLLTGRVAELDRTLLCAAPEKQELPAELDAASLRRLQWLMGHLRHQGRTLLSTVGARTRALHEVLSASQVCSAAPPASRSSAAPPAGRSSVLTEDCVYLQQLCDLLEAYVSWKQVENVFWTWMDSVADHRSPALHVRTSSGRLGTCHRGNQRLAQLEEGLPNPQGQNCRDDPASLPPSPILSVHEAWRPQLQAERTPRGGGGALGALPASQAAELLLQAERLLLQRRDGRRRANRKQLQELMARLEQQVFVPL
ncbi:tubulin epsilon and delta complex protein 1 isoform 2-T2 [Anableps anableps]